MKIRIRLIEPTTQKLNFVKLIKDCSNLGLKDSKNICDNLHANPTKDQVIELKRGINEAGISYYNVFVKRLNEISGRFLVDGGVQWQRNMKMLSIGIGETSDYIEFIKKLSEDNLEILNLTINFALSKLSKEDLMLLVNDINIKYNDNQ